jgi:hypothetical protein
MKRYTGDGAPNWRCPARHVEGDQQTQDQELESFLHLLPLPPLHHLRNI